MHVKAEFGLHWKQPTSAFGVFFLDPVHYLWEPQVQENTNFSLKLSPTALFTYLKNILL